jgi:cytochrome c553
MMSTAAVVLSDQDMQALAEYFTGQTLVRSTAKTDPAIIEQGKQIASEAQCVACHQPNFKGLNEFPRVSRQKVSVSVHRQAAQGFSRGHPRRRRHGTRGQEPDR